jgi:hypothetical protein
MARERSDARPPAVDDCQLDRLGEERGGGRVAEHVLQAEATSEHCPLQGHYAL